MRLILVPFFLFLVACQTAPPPITFEFENFELETLTASSPRILGSIAPLSCFPSDTDCRAVGYSDTGDVDALEAYKIIAEGNTEIAEANAATVDLLKQQVELLVAAGKATEHIQKIREEQLAWEREQRTRETWFYRAFIAVLVVAGVYIN